LDLNGENKNSLCVRGRERERERERDEFTHKENERADEERV
jgi:hypothetical protein